MKRVLDFLNETKLCFVATVDGDAPRVRPQGFFMEYDGKLCLCTADEKETSIQLKKNPKVEVAACQGTKFMRVRGKAEFIADEAAAAKALEILPALAQIIQPGKFEIFAVTDVSVIISDLMTGEAKMFNL